MDDNTLGNNNDFTYPTNGGTSSAVSSNSDSDVKPSTEDNQQNVSQPLSTPGAIPIDVSSKDNSSSTNTQSFNDDPFGLNDPTEPGTSGSLAENSKENLSSRGQDAGTTTTTSSTSADVKSDDSLIPGNLLNNVVDENKVEDNSNLTSTTSSSTDTLSTTNNIQTKQPTSMGEKKDEAVKNPSLTVAVENGDELQNSADASVLEQIEKAEEKKQQEAFSENESSVSTSSNVELKDDSNLTGGMVSAPITEDDLKETDLENKLEDIPLNKPVDIDKAVSTPNPQDVIPITLDQKQDLSSIKNELKENTAPDQESLDMTSDTDSRQTTAESPAVTENSNLEPATEPVNSVEVDSIPASIENASGPAEFDGSIESLLEIVIERNASDLHLTADYPPFIRIDGALQPVINKVLSKDSVKSLVYALLTDDRRKQLEANREIDFAYEYKGGQRFRINAYFQKGSLAAALRLIPSKIRSIDELKLPQIYHQFSRLGQGLVLVTGPTGHGKTTTLAAIIQEINENRADHIITIEDPIEYVYPKAKALIDQREMHDDTLSWAVALRSALREDPDVVLVGEMRDLETIASAITLAETGHLVFATLHTNNAAQSIDRIIDVFPEHQQSQVRAQLADIIEVVIAQRLVPINGGGRRAVSEIMIATPAIRNLIREGKTPQIDNVIRTSADIGMTSLESSLVKLVRDGLISVETAQRYASHPEEITRLMKV